jgi:hypothetical protein
MTTLLPPVPADATVPARSRSALRALLFGGAIGAALGGAGFVVGQQLVGPLLESTVRAMPRSGGMLAVQVVSAWFLSPLLHELGHLAGGAAQSFRFELLVVGPLRIARDATTDRITVGLNRQLELAGGLAACAPTSAERLLHRLQWMVLGGPLTSLLLAVGAVSAWRLNPAAPWSGFTLFTGVLAALTGVATLLPMQNGSFLTDGKRFLQLRGNDAKAHRDAAILLRTVRDRMGVPMTDEPAERIAPMLTPVDGSMFELVGRLMAYAWLLDRGAMAEARSHLARAAAIAVGLPFHLEAAVALDEAYLAALVDGDAAVARALLHRHTRALPLMPAHERLRVETAVAMAEQDYTTARRLLAEARAVVAALPTANSGSAQWTRARLGEMDATLNS